MIVPFGAGGGTDIIARTVSRGTEPGAEAVDRRRAAARRQRRHRLRRRRARGADGYTLLFTAQSTYSLNPNLMKEPPLDQLKDLVPVASIGRRPWLIAVPMDSDVQVGR